ncbi:MAG TPA: hypothetical protein VG929_02565 [Actinomycetota bacterium]|nr:hypothetical protein [Actinomycetota bacterium]
MTHHGDEEHHQQSQSGPVVHGGDGDPLGEGVAEATPDEDTSDAEEQQQPPLPDDEPKPGL